MALDFDLLTTLGLVTSSLIAVISNLLLLLVFFRRRGLRTVSNRFVINLLVTNLLSSVFLVPLLIVDRESESPLGKSEVYTNISTSELDFRNGSSVPRKNATKVFFHEENVFDGSDFFESEFVLQDATLEITEIFNLHGNFSDNFLCFFAQSTTNLICTASILSILLIGIDQFFAVVHPLRYHSFIDKCKSTIFICVCWCISVILASFDALISVDANFWTFCSDRTVIIETDDDLQVFRIVYSIVYFIFVVLMPFLLICGIYVCIYTAARKNSERMRKSTSANSTVNLNSYSQLSVQNESNDVSLPKIQSSPNLTDLQRNNDNKIARSVSERTGKNIITSLKSRISNASVFKYREETRAAKISILVIFMVLICYSPYGLAVLFNTHVYPAKMPHFYNYLSLVLLVASNMASPFIFAYRNRRIQREVLKFLHLIPRKSNVSIRRNFREEMLQTRREIDERDQVLKDVEMSCCKVENEKKGILKRVCSKNWSNYKKCNFITVPDSCLDARGSFSSASTQISIED